MKIDDEHIGLVEVLVARRDALAADESPADAEKRVLLGEIRELIRALLAGIATRDQWDDHDLNWNVYCAHLSRATNRDLARIMIAMEEADDHGSIELTFEEKQQLYWWRVEGGREETLGELPLDERQALEAGA